MSARSTRPIGLAQISCGACCQELHLCEGCILKTLKANGLPVELASSVRGLAQRSRGHSGHYAVEFSELNQKLRALLASRDSADEPEPEPACERCGNADIYCTCCDECGEPPDGCECDHRGLALS